MTTDARTADLPAPPPQHPIERELSTHVNEMHLVGELAAVADERDLPSGDRVMTFRLTVRTESALNTRRAKPDSGARSDSIDCMASGAALMKRLMSYSPGDLIEVHGSLRHRYWRGPSGLNSRYEVEARSVRSRRRAAR